MCWPYISGVIESSGITASKWPKGPIELPMGTSALSVIPDVVAYIEHLKPEDQTQPASESVYEAVVAKYPYKPHRLEDLK
jgi:hypothetical protein